MNAHSAVSGEHHAAILNALVENCFNSVMITEAAPGNSIVYVNKAFTDLTGYAAEEVLGKSPNSYRAPPPTQPFCNGCTRIWRPGVFSRARLSTTARTVPLSPCGGG